MDRELVFEKLVQIFRDVFDDDTLEITEKTTARDIEDWDSFEHVNLIVAIEAEFQFKFPLDLMGSMENVGQTVDIILELAK